jgi:CHAT domain-containing protein
LQLSQITRNDAEQQAILVPLAQEILRKQPGTVILYPLVLPDKIWILMASEGGLLTRYEVKVNQAELNQTVFELRELLQSPTSDLMQLNALSQKLYGWLIQPLESELKTTINGAGQTNYSDRLPAAIAQT